MLKRRAFLLMGSAAAFVGAKEAQAFFMGGVGVSGLTNLQPPTISSMTPNNGLTAGGNTVTFIGFSFCTVTSVMFGTLPATNIIITNNDVLTCAAPLHANGAVNVVLTNAAGPSAPVVYTYGSPPVVTSISPTQGPVAGGTPLQVFGSSFTGATEIRIGGTPATSFAFVSDGQVNGTTPPGSGVDDVVVTNPNGSGTLASAFTYTGTFSTSIPLGSFVGEYTGSGGGTAANGDGTTGWTTTGGWTVLQTWVNFPSNDFYRFVIPAYCNVFAGIPGNSIQIYIDQIMIPTDIGTTTNNNWFSQFVSNTAPVQNYSFTCPVTAGQHSIQIMLNTNAYYGIGPVNNNIHADRLNISSTGAGFPAEPSPQTRNPLDFPMSSWHMINTPFGANATWLALSNPVAQTINGTGGNGASVAVHSATDSFPRWRGTALDPVFTARSNDTINLPTPTVLLPYPVRAPAGAYQSFGGPTDGGMVLLDTTAPRYAYVGFAASVTGRTATWGTMVVQDNYNLNHSSPQGSLGGYGTITVADLDAGAIRHRLVGGLASRTTVNVGYGLGTQTSNKSGMPWPGGESDHDWLTRFTNPNGPPYGSVIGIPPTIAKPAGLNAGTSMAWDAMQNYGCFLNLSAGNPNSAAIAIIAEGQAFNHPRLAEINWATIVANLSVMSNPAPIVLNTANPQGFGGGNVRVPLLPGLIQGYPSIGISPYTFPSSPVGIPTQLQASIEGSAIGSGVAFGSAKVAASIPVGSFVLMFYCLDRAPSSAVSFQSLTDSAGNTYQLIQPTAVVNIRQVAMAVCLSTTNAITSGTTWTPILTPLGIANYFLMGGYFLPRPASGAVSLRVSNSATTASSVTTLSTTLAGVQAGDLVIGYTRTNNYAEIVDPAGFSSLLNNPPSTQSFRTAAAAGTVTYNPTWNFASSAALVAAAFNVGASSGGPTVTTAVDTGTTLASGSTAGNRPVTITGSGFTGATAVTFGGVAAKSFTVASATSITCRTPPHAAGAVSVVVTVAGVSNGANTAYSYVLTSGNGGTGTTLAVPAVASAQGYNTLSFQDEFSDLQGVDVTFTNGSGFSWYPKSYGWTNNTVFANAGAAWSSVQQLYLAQYYSVASSILTMIGHVDPQPDTLSSLRSTIFATNAQGYTGTVVPAVNGFYFECRCAGLGTTSNSFWCNDNRALTGVNTTTFLELDMPEMFTTPAVYYNLLQWVPPAGQNYFVNHFLLGTDNNFHIYGLLYVPPAQASGNGFFKFYVDGVLKTTTAVTTGSTLANIMAVQQHALYLLTDPNTNSNPFQVDYVRCWQQTATG